MDNLLLEDGAIELVLDAKTDAVEASRTAATTHRSLKGSMLALIAIGVLALVSVVATATETTAAGAWAEAGDAGELPGTAQVPAGSGSLDAISGAITPAADADMYQVCLTGGGTFSATTGPPGSHTFDTQLFLFDAAGNGVYANDDSLGIGLGSLLPAGHALTPATAGTYYLAVSAWDNDPVSAGGLIFPNTFNDVDGPTGPGGALAISGWTVASGDDPGEYTIALTGAEFC